MPATRKLTVARSVVVLVILVSAGGAGFSAQWIWTRVVLMLVFGLGLLITTGAADDQ